MFETDEQIIIHALNMWKNHIETGNVLLSANDAIEQKKHKLLKPISEDTRILLIKIKLLRDKYIGVSRW